MGSAGMIGRGSALLADFNPRFLWPTLALVGSLLLGAVIIALADRWRKRPANEGLTAGDQLSHFRKLYDQGLITREEFEAVRTQLAGKLRDELKLPAQAETPPAPAAEAPRPPEAPPGPSSDGVRPA